MRRVAPDNPEYKVKDYGDLRARDAAYHQGTVWPWLIGRFLEAWMKLHPEERAGAHQILEGFDDAITTPSRPPSRAAASPRPGAWPKSCGAG